MTLRDPSLTDLRRVAVFGLGRSGVAAANLLVDLGVDVLASAPSEPASLEALRDGVAVHIGGNVFAGCDLVVASPGIPPSARVFEDVRATGVSVWSEVELAWRATKAPFLGISGTDGKTTTTSVLGAMIEAWGERPSRVAGNIGTPLSEVALDLPDDGVVVAELSAFQLWSTARFRPHVAGLTNIAPDHLDYFRGDWDAYVAAKRVLVDRLTARDLAVLNRDDPASAGWASSLGAPVATYGLDEPGPSADAAWRSGDKLIARFGGDELVLVEDVRALHLMGSHNHLNLMCAALMALGFGCDPAAVRRAASEFRPLAHRIEPVGAVDGVQFVDDSKATNAHAAIAGIRSVEGPIVPIVGGVDKGLELDVLAQVLSGRAAHVVLIGALTGRMRDALVGVGFNAVRIHEAQTMEEAVRVSYEHAKPDGATVILSPACSSFDMFDSYAHRGEVFQHAVRSLGLPE